MPWTTKGRIRETLLRATFGPKGTWRQFAVFTVPSAPGGRIEVVLGDGHGLMTAPSDWIEASVVHDGAAYELDLYLMPGNTLLAHVRSMGEQGDPPTTVGNP